MTKEKIINYLGELGGFASSQGWDDEYRQATIEAIEALTIIEADTAESEDEKCY